MRIIQACKYDIQRGMVEEGGTEGLRSRSFITEPFTPPPPLQYQVFFYSAIQPSIHLKKKMNKTERRERRTRQESSEQGKTDGQTDRQARGGHYGLMNTGGVSPLTRKDAE